MTTYLLPHAITESALRHPDREALRFAGASLTYAALAERSDRLAQLLVESGVRRGDRIAFYMNKCLESVVALYGIMKAGAAYVPLDPFAPVARLAFVLRDCDVRCLISREEKREQIRQVLELGTQVERIVGVQAGPDLTVAAASTWADVDAMPATCPCCRNDRARPGLYPVYLRFDGRPQRHHAYASQRAGLRPVGRCGIWPAERRSPEQSRATALRPLHASTCSLGAWRARRR